MFSVFWPPVGFDASQITEGLEDTPWSNVVVLENVPDDMTDDFLTLLVESFCGHSEVEHSLELISESNAAVVTFKDPSGMSLTCNVK